MSHHVTPLAVALLLAAGIAPFAQARTKLTTLPERERLVTSLDKPNQALLFEERTIPLQRGTNTIDFSWTGVSIDPNSIRLEFLTHPGEEPQSTRMIATGFPPNENALTWQVFSPEARTERVRVSYLLNGITFDHSYELEVNEEETAGEFRQYLRLRNNSGEDLDDVALRLPGMDEVSRSVDSGETRRFLAERVDALPVEKLYVSRPGYMSYRGEDGEAIGLVYEIENTAGAGLGKRRLEPGKVRIFGDDGLGSAIFLGEDMLPMTAPAEDAELTLGSVKDVVVKRRLMQDQRFNIRNNSNGSVALFDLRRQIRYEVENFKDGEVSLRIHERMPVADWEVEEVGGTGIEVERISINELEVTVQLPPRKAGAEVEKKTFDLTFLMRNRFENER